MTPGDGTVLLSSGVVVMAATLPLVDGGVAACVMYRFAKPDGTGFHPPVLLAPGDDELFMLNKLTQDAARSAVRTAKLKRPAP